MTPLEKIDGIYFKREDLNPTGSVKDRWLSVKIKPNVSYVISSTGNAAISAQHYSSDVTVFVSPNTPPSKLVLLKNYFTTSLPISAAFKYAKSNNIELLRQSNDPIAIEAYSQISDELITQLPEITSLFVPVGSGTTLLGIASKLPPHIKLFAVQPASHCPIASHFDKNFTPETETVTDALGVKLLPLKNKILNTVKYGVVVDNKSTLDNLMPQFCPETALCLAGLKKARTIHDIGNFPVILVTGTKR